MTSANFPDVMMPAYYYSRFYWLLFIAFIIITMQVQCHLHLPHFHADWL